MMYKCCRVPLILKIRPINDKLTACIAEELQLQSSNWNYEINNYIYRTHARSVCSHKVLFTVHKLHTQR